MKKEKRQPVFILVLISLVFSSAVAWGQEPSKEEQEKPQGTELKQEEQGQTPVSRYKGQGKRDPFRSLLTIKEEDRNKVIPPPPLEDRPPGLPGLLISEVSVAGVATGNTKKIIVLKGIDGVSYIAEPGSRLYDGTLAEVDESGVIFSRTEKTTDGKSKTYKVTKPFNSSEKQVLP